MTVGVQARDTGAAGATRALDRHALANDASHFRLIPQRVIRATDVVAVAQILNDARKTRTPVTFRAGGTSLSGQAVTDGVLVDVRRYFQRVQVLHEGERVRVQPGATVRQVNARLLRHGRKLGPDPASEGACTIGGVVANNSSGMSCGTVQNAYSTLESVTVVLASGTIVDTGALDADYRLRREEPRLYTGLEDARDRLRSRRDLVAEVRRLFAMKNTMGYGLNAFLDFDEPCEILAHLMVGSEGTLGFIAEAVLRTVPLPKNTTTGLFVFPDLAAANDALPALVESGAAAIELLDARSLSVASRDTGAAGTPVAGLSVSAQAALLIEYYADDPTQLDAREFDAQTTGAGNPGMFTRDAAQRAALWRIRKGLYAAVAGARRPGTMALLEDIAVPVSSLTATCQHLTGLVDRHGYEDSVIFGHAKDGNIHFMLTDRFSEPAPLSRYAAFTEELVDLVLGNGGTLKAEHGTGRVMAPFVERQYGSELYKLVRRVKDLFDPAGVLNPGVIITDEPDTHLRNIKTMPAIETEVDRCVECGFCEPVCPSKDLTLTPRQRIVIRRAQADAAAGDHALAAELDAEYEYDGIQTCAVDGMCQTVCPVLINTGDLIKRLRTDRHPPVEKAVWSTAAAHWRTGTRTAAAALTAAKAAPPVARAVTRAARTLLGSERIPLWTPELPRGGRARTRTRTPSPEAVYFPSCVNSLFGQRHGRSGVQASFELLYTLAGARIRVPEDIDNYCCGTPWTSKGLPRPAAIMRDRVKSAIREATDDGVLPVICDASSCTEGLRQTLMAEGIIVMDSIEYTATHLLPRLPRPARVQSLLLHPTCSSTRLGVNDHLHTIAQTLAHTVTIPDTWGCCAFAGDRGMLHPELTTSATRAQAAEIANTAADLYASCNRTCELGMTRATGKPYQHILETLAHAIHNALTTEHGP